jgi:hypothetical protein
MLVRNRPRLTKQALVSLNKSVPECTIMILDDRSDAETLDAMDVCADCAIIARNVQPQGTGQLRNMVIRESVQNFGRGDYLYLSDNDVFFQSGWLDTLIQYYELARPLGFLVIGGVNHPFNQPTGKLPIMQAGKEIACVNEVVALATQSMLMSWDVWDEFGPFVETPVDRVCMSEDVAFGNKIRAAGFKLGVVSPALIVSTGITNTFGERIPGWELVKSLCPEGILCE